ncbi:MAG: HD domain-containing protein [Peptococcaceae bacterium]|nr:HD domain-containing protein [Peptococcaceae bacterium]
MKLKFETVKDNKTICTYIEKADRTLAGMGFTEHSFAHVTHVASVAGKLLKDLGYKKHDIELARVAGYMHDIGNVVNRHDHAQTGALMAMRILDHLGACDEDVAAVITAIGNHDEPNAYPVDAITAAIIIADKTDVRQTRVRNKDQTAFDIHDRVNYAVKQSSISVENGHLIEARLKLDKSVCSVMDYFEIFLERMVLCRKAAETLGCEFALVINKERVI